MSLPSDRKKEFLNYFIKYLNTLNKTKMKNFNNRPSTSESVTKSLFKGLKRSLNSPESPKRNTLPVT